MEEESQEYASDFEAALITRILDDKDVRTPITQKITSDFFYNTTNRAAWDYIVSSQRSSAIGGIPSWETFAERFSAFIPERISDTTVALCEGLRRVKVLNDLSGLLNYVAEQSLVDPMEAFTALQEMVAGMKVAHTVDNSLDLSMLVDQLREEYDDVKAGGTGLRGLPWAFAALNKATLGLQGGHLVVIYGRPKAGKSTFALLNLFCLYLMGCRVAVFAMESSAIEIAAIVASMHAGVDMHKVDMGTLTPAEEAKYRKSLEVMRDSPGFIVDRLEAKGAEALSELDAKIEDLAPHAVLIDGAYLASGVDWKDIAGFTQGSKRIAMKHNIPVIMTTQSNKTKGKSGKEVETGDDLAFGDGFQQDCNAAIRVTAMEPRTLRRSKIAITTLRRGRPCTIVANMRPGYDFRQIEVEEGEESQVEEAAQANETEAAAFADGA